jgi:hypothetical protein
MPKGPQGQKRPAGTVANLPAGNWTVYEPRCYTAALSECWEFGKG